MNSPVLKGIERRYRLLENDASVRCCRYDRNTVYFCHNDLGFPQVQITVSKLIGLSREQ